MTPRIISEGSPLDRLPAGLDHAQRGWLEGLRYSVEIADLSMRRLRGLLLDLVGRASAAGESQQVILDPDAYTAVVADAWTFLDATWRLKRFLVDGRLPRPPGPPQEPPEETDVTLDLSRFEDALTDVKAAREPLSFVGVNVVGLRRRGFDDKAVARIEDIYREIFVRSNNLERAVQSVEQQFNGTVECAQITEFIRNSPKGIMRGLAELS